MRPVELSRRFSLRAPLHQEFSVFVELHDTGFGDLLRGFIALRNEKRAVRQPRHVSRPVHMILVVGRNAGFTECHNELLTIVCELEHPMAGVIDDPDVTLGIVRTDLYFVWTFAALGLGE